MNAVLVKARKALDKTVDSATAPNLSLMKRIDYLFELHDKHTSGMFVTVKL